MTAAARLLDQRAIGHVRLRMEKQGVAVLREAGCSKLRVPRGSSDAILINVSGGLAGGDAINIAAEVGDAAMLSLTTQAAERVYRTLGPPADVAVSLKAGAGATLVWAPQETIFFEGSALSRKLDVQLAADATFLAVEPMVFGRHEAGEVVRQISMEDRWQVWQSGQLMHAEAFRLGPEWPSSKARLGEYRATATVLLVAPDLDLVIERVRATLGQDDGASAWNGKLAARIIAKDGYALRKTLIQVMRACIDEEAIPKCWLF